jgi:hypothetical protein
MNTNVNTTVTKEDELYTNTLISNEISTEIQNPSVVIEKKKRGRKKNVKIEVDNASQPSDNISSTPIVEKKIRKRRSKKDMLIANAAANIKIDKTTDVNNIAGDGDGDGDGDGLNVVVKTRKRRVCKSKKNENNTDENIILDHPPTPPEEKVIKKRGRKPKGGKIINQKLEENNNNNELPNIILHLKCSIRDIKNINTDSADNYNVEQNEIQSYNSSQLKGSEIYVKNSLANNTSSNLTLNNTINSNPNPIPIPISKDNSSHLFKVYDNMGSSSIDTQNITNKNSCSSNSNSNITSDTCTSKNSIYSNNTPIFFDNVYSPDINSYSNDYNNRTDYDDCDDCDDGDNIAKLNKGEKDIWRKINQLKISFHKSDICKNVGGTQRSACFWCTCEFDSPAIYIPKTLTKDVYNVYGCFCSPECAAAFLMNENVDTSTKFERYHLLNLLYGKIYKYEKSIKIAPNPFYLLNKFYGNLTIQEYRKLFQSEQMIYVVNKPLTHILPELYEDNNDFLLNNKIIPNNTVNIRKNKPLKSNIINNAFGIGVTSGGK